MKVSVIVPVRDEEDSIRTLLDGLLNQSRKPDEIVITDGGSTDSTTDIISGYILQGAPIKLIVTKMALPGHGRNLGARAADSEWLGFIDAGIKPDRHWLEYLVKKAEGDATIDVVYGSWAPVTNSFFKECAAIAYVPPPRDSDGESLRPRSITSTLMRKKVWQAVGGFPEYLRSGEDLVFMNRIDAAGFCCVSESRAIVYWQIKPSMTSTFKRFVTYSRNNIRAGLWRDWQLTIFRRYLVLLFLTIPAFWRGPSWLLLPFGAWLVLLFARAAVAIRRNRFCFPAKLVRNLGRIFAVTAVIVVLDAAAFIGTFEWLLKDSFRQNPTPVMEADDDA